ncbi:MAG: TonB-dependent receptor [Leptothrix sp. (in: Bacteria)]|nr:TonB-dependent receptor [Leptothrix sp. (in: b-proteobacteria)]
MFKKSKVCVSVLALLAGPAMAQDVQRIEITGSSIKRIAAEGALPVITLTKADIERSGATSVRDLVSALPSMQGFTYVSDSVNGGGGGTATASLRNLGSVYTLVLLNGRRVAPFNTGSTVNLEQLPISAIERVEILADGASTLYGADAIAGVVNFITKKNTSDGSVDLRVLVPQKKGGKETQASIGKGFGSLDRDGFNVYAALSFEKEEKIAASEREFSKSGVIPFTHKGQKLYFWQLSANANPPNVDVGDNAGTLGAFYNPQLILNGNCGSDPGAKLQGATCRFDYASTVEAKPEAERTNLSLSGTVKLGKDFSGFVEAVLSDTSVTARFAPPAQALSMALGGTLFNRYVVPTIASQGLTVSQLEYADYYMRLRDAGLRANEYRTKAKHLVLGLEGSVAGFDGSLTFTKSSNTADDIARGGYTSRNQLNALIAGGTFDPFVQGTAASKAALAPAVLTGIFSSSDSSLDIFSFKASRALFGMDGGSAYLGVGLDLMKQGFSTDPSPISQGPNPLQPNFTDFPVGGTNGQLPFDTTRNSRGAFAELMMPVLKSLEVTAAVRNDAYDPAKNTRNFDSQGNPLPAAVQGNKSSKNTYKLGLRFQPVPELLLRASAGTGFRAPTLNDITAPLADFGVIGVQRACPVTTGDPLFPGCRPNPTQWRALKGGNPFTGSVGLRPETSEQWTTGIRFEPDTNFNVGVEFWSVTVKDVITEVPEDTAFDNFARYRRLFAVTTDPATGRPILTFIREPLNGALAKSKGVDLDLTVRAGTPIGKLTGQVAATYLVESYIDYGFGGGKESSIGKMGADDKVAFRTLLRLQGTLESGAFTNSLTLYWKPGYTDQAYTAVDQTVRVRNDDGTPGAFVAINDWKVPSYYTVDWQGKYSFSKALSFTAGIKNLMDKQPPLSIKTVGGNQLGFDPRYADGIGRRFYLQGSYKF